jgi:hypothetical protein
MDALTFTGQAQTKEQFIHGQAEGMVGGAVGGVALGIGIPLIGGAAKAVAPEMTQLAADGAKWALNKVVTGAENLIANQSGRRIARETAKDVMQRETGATTREMLAAELRSSVALPTRAATSETAVTLARTRSTTVAEFTVVERTAITTPVRSVADEPVTVVARRETTALLAPSRLRTLEANTVVQRYDPFPIQGTGYFDRIRPVATERTVVYQMLQRDMAYPGSACLPSSCRMVLRKHKIDISVKDLGDAMGVTSEGAYLRRAADVLDGLTMNGRTIQATYEGASSPGALIRGLQQGDDAIVSISRQAPGQAEASSHAVIVEQFDTGLNFVRIRDPYYGVYDVSVREFLERWTRRTLFIR